MRGKPEIETLAKAKIRITPAGAGKTQPKVEIHHGQRDHPRRCGENRADIGNTLAASGSPPQVRGKPGHGRLSFALYRITPAGAGKTMCVTIRTKTPQDHPRRCGENLEQVVNVQQVAGSPPQVRGKRRAWCLSISACRITPAGAGKTLGLAVELPCR